MESKQHRPKANPDTRLTRYQKNTDFEVYANETVTEQKDVKKKKVHYKKGFPTENKIQDSLFFQVPENDKVKFVVPDNSLAKASKYNGKDCRLGHKDQMSVNKISNPTNTNYESGYVSYSPKEDGNLKSRERMDNQQGGREQITNKVSYGQPRVNYDTSTYHGYNNNQGSLKGETPSLICRAINHDGEPVTVNDQVVRDKLILSCRPRSCYGAGSYVRRPVNVDHERDTKYIHNSADVNVLDNVNITQTTDFEYQHKIYERPKTVKPPLERADAVDFGSLGMGEHPSATDKQVKSYEEQYRAIQCKRYARNFKGFLWALLIINILLVIVGVALLLLSLIHLLFRDYMNIVIAHRGFALWIWGALVLSMIIIVVGIYGIITAITRSRCMLSTYCIISTILALLILIFMLIFWLMHTSLKETQQKEMTTTFNMYRCQRLVRQAWDSLHEKHQCCGVEARGDWKYIPPSCCHAETKFQKLACINHFIHEDQAFKSGCRPRLEDYFTTRFLLITCLLVLAFILLLLGILAALRLIKMYKVILMCRDMYLITP